MWTITSNTTRKILQIHKKRKMFQPVQEWLQPGRKQKQNLNRGKSAGTTTTIPIQVKEVWIGIEPSKQDLESYNLSKKVINLLRHNQKLHREARWSNSILQESNSISRDHHPKIQNWCDDRWLACLAAGGGPKRRYQYCSDYLGSIIYLRALQGHSGSNLIDPTLQDNVLIGPGISLTFTMWEAISIFIQLSAMDWYLEVKIWAEDKQCSSCLLIQEMKITKIQSFSTTLHHVLHDTCKMHGRDIKTRYFGSILILESEKD